MILSICCAPFYLRFFIRCCCFSLDNWKIRIVIINIFLGSSWLFLFNFLTILGRFSEIVRMDDGLAIVKWISFIKKQPQRLIECIQHLMWIWIRELMFEVNAMTTTSRFIKKKEEKKQPSHSFIAGRISVFCSYECVREFLWIYIRILV